MDEISLTLPADEAFHRVVYLVVGGLAARHDLTLEHLEDLELALETLLGRYDDDGEVTVRMRLGDGELRAAVGRFATRGVLDELEQEADESLGLRRILETVSDQVEVHDGWVELTKRIDGQR